MTYQIITCVFAVVQMHSSNLSTTLRDRGAVGGGGGWETPYNQKYGEASSERGTFLRLQVYERVGKSVISVGKQMHFMVVKKTSKLSGFVIYSYFKDCEFTAVKRDAKVLTRHTICQ